MKLMITGASGFIGERLLGAATAAFGAENVIAFSSKRALNCSSIVYSGTDFNLSTADHAMLATVDILIHVGAFTPKNVQQSNAINECNTNIYFTEKLLALPFKALKKVVYISTVDVYEPTELTTEDTPTLPVSLYGCSKLYCERMAAIFAVKHNLVCHILRIGHVYGPGEEKYGKFLPKTIKNILAGEPVELWGDGNDVRSFIYINDVVIAILYALKLRDNVGPINVVGGKPVTIRDLLDQIIAISGKKVLIKQKEYNYLNRRFIFDNTKMRKYLLPDETELITGLETEYNYMAGLL